MGVIREWANRVFADGPASAPKSVPKDNSSEGVRGLFAVVDDRVEAAHNLAQNGQKPVKDPVRVLTTTDVAIASVIAGSTLEGVVLAAGDGWVKAFGGDTGHATNGAYVVQAAGGSLRRQDMDTSDELILARFQVLEGSRTGEIWGVRNPAAITVGTTPIVIKLGESQSAALTLKADKTTVGAVAIDDGALLDFVSGVKAVRNAVSGDANVSAMIGNGVTFSRGSAKEVVAQSGAAMQLVKTPAGQPAVAYSQRSRRPRGLDLGDAVESVIRATSFTNSMTAPGQWLSTGTSTITHNVVPSADGAGNTASRIVCSNVATAHQIYYEGAPTVSGRAYVFSILVRRETLTAGGVWLMRNAGIATGVRFMWNADGSLSPTVTHGAPFDYGWVQVSDTGYYLIWMSLAADSASTQLRVYFVDPAGVQGHTNADEWHFNGAWLYEGYGLRAGPRLTGTIGSTERDVLQIDPAVVFPRKGKAGAFQLKTGKWVERANQNHTFFQLHNSGGSERILLRNETRGQGEIIAQITNAAGTVVNLSAGKNLQAGADVAVTWSSAGVEVYTDGAMVASNPIVLDMALANTCYVGATSPAATTNFLAKSLRYWPYKITASHLTTTTNAAYKIEVRDGHAVIVDAAGAVVSLATADVSSVSIQTATRIAFTSDMYGGLPRAYQQVVPGSTPVLKGLKRELELFISAGQSLSEGSSSAPGDMVITAPRHPPAVLMFNVGPAGKNSDAIAPADLATLQPGKSIASTYGGANIQDAPITAFANSMAQRRLIDPTGPSPVVAMSVGVGATALADLMEGGATQSWLNNGKVIDGFVARALALAFAPVVSWYLFNQGENDTNAALASYKTLQANYFAALRSTATSKTGQTRQPKFVVQQIGSRKASTLPSGICEVPLAQAQNARELTGVYLHPMYPYIHSYGGAVDGSHLASKGYVLAAEMSAVIAGRVEAFEKRASRPTTVRQSDLMGCRLMSWSIAGTTVKLKFNVPGRGEKLVYDATTLPAFPNWGLEFLVGSAPVALSGSPVITSDDEITITLAAAPGAGAQAVRLGYTNTTPTVTPGGSSVFPGTNIRTSAEYPSQEFADEVHRDWAQIDLIASA